MRIRLLPVVGVMLFALLAPEASAQNRPLDDFKCYEIRKNTPRFNARNVMLTDQFAANEATRVIRPEEHCNPAAIGREQFLNPRGHLKCYAIRPLLQPLPAGRVEVTNRYGTARLDVGRPVRLCNPTRKRVGPGDLPPPVGPSFTDHFKCYRVDPVDRFRRRRVRLTDQFIRERFRVLRPALLCNPAQKDAEGVDDPDSHLVCYSIDLSGGGFEPTFLFNSRDQFGRQRMRVRARRSLCVPSRKRRI